MRQVVRNYLDSLEYWQLEELRRKCNEAGPQRLVMGLVRSALIHEAEVLAVMEDLRLRVCPTCKASGFPSSKGSDPTQCTFCDGTEGGRPPRPRAATGPIKPKPTPEELEPYRYAFRKKVQPE